MCVQVLPVIDHIGRHFIECESVMDHICSFHKHWLRASKSSMPAVVRVCCGLARLMLASELLTVCTPCAMCELFQIPGFAEHLKACAALRFYPSYMYAVMEAVNKYGGEPLCEGPLLELVSMFATTTANILSTTPTAFVDSPALLIDFYAMMRAALRHLTARIAVSPVFRLAADISMHALTLQHREAVSGVRKFWIVRSGACAVVVVF